MDILLTAEFWAALGSIILANVLLSGDNAVVIAMAARGLPARQQKSAIVFGSGAAIVMRIALTLIAVKMLGLPWLKLAGGLALLWIGANLMSDEEEQHDGEAKTIGVGAAVRTILLADLVMSLDNVLAVAAAAQGNTVLLIIGLAISIPLIVFGSTLILKLMERLPFIIAGGCGPAGLAGRRNDAHRSRRSRVVRRHSRDAGSRASAAASAPCWSSSPASCSSKGQTVAFEAGPARERVTNASRNPTAEPLRVDAGPRQQTIYPPCHAPRFPSRRRRPRRRRRRGSA